jgi:hypothetical protein
LEEVQEDVKELEDQAYGQGSVLQDSNDDGVSNLNGQDDEQDGLGERSDMGATLGFADNGTVTKPLQAS